MAIRNIVKLGDEILTKKCREVKNIDDRIICLLDDMIETLKKANGVGLAAPQVGILKRIDSNGNEYEYTGEDLTARAFCHEIDHLDGHFFTEKVTEWVDTEE